MKNRLKGLTLLETVIYLGLFSVIMLIITNFMLSTQEATARTDRRATIHKTSQFIAQHLYYTFEKSTTVNSDNSIFLDDQGKVELLVDTENKLYEIVDSKIYYDSVALSPQNLLVQNFYLEPIYKDTDIIAVKIRFTLSSIKDSNITEETNLLLTLR